MALIERFSFDTWSYIIMDNSFCCKCKNKTEDEGVEYLRTKNDKLRKKSTCKECGTKKSKFVCQKTGGALTNDETDEADYYSRLAASSYQKPEERREYLDKHGLQDYEIHEDDSKHQDPYTAVYTKNGKKTVVMRGTVPTNAGDWRSNAHIATTTFKRSRRYKDWSATVNDLKKKYGDDAIEMLVGHSLGGKGSLQIGQEHGIASHSFNPGSSPLDLQQNVFKELKCKLDPSKCYHLKKHKLWHVHGDVVSLGKYVSPYTNRYIMSKSLNPHALSNWHKD